MANEPCASCGEETATGSIFYSDRRAIDTADEPTAFLCTICNSRLRVSRKGAAMTDNEVRSMIANGSAAGIAWGGGVSGA